MELRKSFKSFLVTSSRTTLVLIVVVCATTMAFVMNFLQSIFWWGFISKDLLMIGTIDALVIAFILAPLLVKYVSKMTALEKEIISREIIAKSERLYKLIAENVHDVVWVLDVETLRFRYISPSVFKQTGFTSQESLDKNLDEVLYQESLELVKKVLSEKMEILLSGREVENVKLELLQPCKDGTQKWIEVYTHLILNQENGKLEIVGVSRDIHERKIVEERIKENQLRLSRAELVARLGNWELDLKTRVIVGSTGAQEIYGVKKNTWFWNESEIKKIPLPEYRLRLVSSLRAVVNGERPYQTEFKIKKADTGEIRDIYSLTQYDSERGLVFGIIQDITERKKIELELKMHKENLEKLVEERTYEIETINKQLIEEIEKEHEVEEMLKESLAKEKEISDLKSRFVSTTSHEFRTPLTAILSSSQMLKRYDEKWPKEKRINHLDKIVASIHDLVKMLDEILTFSKADSGKIKLNKIFVELDKVCGRIVEEALASKKENVHFTHSFKNIDRMFNLDENILKLVISNLLVNAFKYSPNGGKVFLEVLGNEKYIKIIVQDEGIGIPVADQKYLFEPFYRASNSTNIQGTGLGLSIVKKYVDLHDGMITVFSEEGKGTEFKVKIPC